MRFIYMYIVYECLRTIIRFNTGFSVGGRVNMEGLLSWFNVEQFSMYVSRTTIMTFPQNGKIAEVSTGYTFFIVLVYTLQYLYRKKKKGLYVFDVFQR